MKSKHILRRQISVALASIASLLAIAPWAQANQLFFGLGGTYTQIQLPTSSAGAHAIYRGPGILGELRFRLLPGDFGMESFGLDLFGVFGHQFTSNVGTGINESNSNRQLGGGMDFRIGKLFLGMQYTSNTSSISLAQANSSQLKYSSYGARLGLNLTPVSSSSSILLLMGASIQFGSIDLGGGASSSLNQYSGFLQVGFDLFGLFGRGY